MTPDRVAVRAAVMALTVPPKPGEAPDLGVLRTLLAAYPRRPLWLDAEQDHGTGGTEFRGIVAASTDAEISAGADEVHEIGDLHPLEATALAVAAINALPWPLDQAAGKDPRARMSPQPARSQYLLEDYAGSGCAGCGDDIPAGTPPYPADMEGNGRLCALCEPLTGATEYVACADCPDRLLFDVGEIDEHRRLTHVGGEVRDGTADR